MRGREMKACGHLVWRPTATFALRPVAVVAGNELSTLLITRLEFEVTEKRARGTQFNFLCVNCLLSRDRILVSNARESPTYEILNVRLRERQTCCFPDPLASTVVKLG